MWKTFEEIPKETGYYWYYYESLRRPILVEIAEITEETYTDDDNLSYNTVRLCEGLKIWPDRVIRFPSQWVGPLSPPSLSVS